MWNVYTWLLLSLLVVHIYSMKEEIEEDSLQFGRTGKSAFSAKVSPNFSWNSFSSIFGKVAKRSYLMRSIRIPMYRGLMLKKIDLGPNYKKITETHSKMSRVYREIQEHLLIEREKLSRAIRKAEEDLRQLPRALAILKDKLAKEGPNKVIEKAIGNYPSAFKAKKKEIRELICEKHTKEVTFRRNELKLLKLGHKLEDLKLENSYLALKEYVPKDSYEEFKEDVFNKVKKFMEASEEELESFLDNPNVGIKAPLTLNKIGRAYGLYFRATKLSTNPELIEKAKAYREKAFKKLEGWVIENYSKFIKLKPKKGEDVWVNKKKMAKIAYRANAVLIAFNMVDLEHQMKKAKKELQKEKGAKPKKC